MTEQEKDAAWVEERLPEDWPWAAECPAPACEVCKAGRLMAEEVEARRAAEDREQVLKEEIEGLRKKLEAEAERPAICAYCNEGVYVNDADGLKRLRKHVEQECPLHPIRKVEAERVALQAQLDELQEQHRRIIAEECPTDEKHCGCVPALRGEIGQLQGENERLKAALHQLRHTNYPGCM